MLLHWLCQPDASNNGAATLASIRLHIRRSEALTDDLAGAGEDRLRHGKASSAFAVFRLMTSSNLVGSMTGRSAGFSPLRMRST